MDLKWKLLQEFISALVVTNIMTISFIFLTITDKEPFFPFSDFSHLQDYGKSYKKKSWSSIKVTEKPDK